jgi:hypothetical protein
MFTLLSCNNTNDEQVIENHDENEQVEDETYLDAYVKSLSPDVYDQRIIDIATYVLRKPDAATWQSKFNPEFREYYINKSKELELIYALQTKDTIFIFLIRDGRDQNGKANRGVGAKMVLDPSETIIYFEELFVTKIIDRINLEAIGKRFINTIRNGESLNDFIKNPNSSIEWPDGRLFYSIDKHEWRYEN